jgi:hypothetical protein
VNGERNPTVEPDNEAKYLRMSGWMQGDSRLKLNWENTATYKYSYSIGKMLI